MITFKDVSDSFIKMTDIRLNIAIFISCNFLIYISPDDKFILDPFPKAIVQALILVTLVRIVFAAIVFFHEKIHSENEKKRQRKQKENEIIHLKNMENEKIKSSLHNLQSLDILQLKVVKDLKKTNTILLPKTAILFSLKALGIVQAVSTGEKAEGVTLTGPVLTVIKNNYENDLNELEHDAIIRFFKSLETYELECFEDMLEIDYVRTYYSSGGRLHETKYHKTFEAFRNSILFEHPIREFNFRLSTNARSVLTQLKSHTDREVL